MHLQCTSLHPSDIESTTYRRSIECNIQVNDQLFREHYSPNRSAQNSRKHNYRDSFNQRLVDSRRGRQNVNKERTELSPENPGFCMKFDMSEYRPEHITVQARGHILFIQASCEEYKNGVRTLKEYSKRVDIPRDVDIDLLISRYSSEGVLTIEVPVCPHPSPFSSRQDMRQV